ncbi:LSU ribosomal protein L24P [Candidatus Frackibacter sp. WG12]|nr:MAG: large subunit ribosomal protein L24 [Candidatus Frackibacter sp. T328-2]SDC22280.1 LSU ribosomal protein L24P [Candidatus Frackibacter sp. WG11]SEM49617.1 LSU ribosomal protein L24P [Candidatus Frackibacter sp. WG12]SFL51110.1 LSU ribosomal protein L24P [Candidatus Frackibacter sp. WG13]
MTIPKLSIKQGDKVKVIAGNDKGKSGEVLRALPRENRVIVEGINIRKKHQRPTQDMPQGGIVEREAPIAVSNVKLICKHCDQPTRTGKEKLDSGEKVRTCKKCGEFVD